MTYVSDAAEVPTTARLASYLDGLREGQLRITRCTVCGLAQFPPRTVCPDCSATASGAWEVASGHGRVWSFCVFHKAYLPEPAPQPPYTVAVVQLDEGPKLITNIVAAEPAELSVGMPVEPVFGLGGAAEVRFRPVREEAR
ncbi:Zn-ribbon domain-containing OB-fold protein [Rhodococcus sp. MSC1_016]|jgi:uncharacterized OB-fold protein|uniref:Zn-ribbon domain-containing OB-fold protein n=1 Tax=Rhodococcus sp. MSC1_016 TaxID=2909266 RepID=UPI002030540D|nr:Zn-ribbon domain-containing OB-fold protein [Rhodococcus sp. MSC1_016]